MFPDGLTLQEIKERVQEEISAAFLADLTRYVLTVAAWRSEAIRVRRTSDKINNHVFIEADGKFQDSLRDLAVVYDLDVKRNTRWNIWHYNEVETPSLRIILRGEAFKRHSTLAREFSVDTGAILFGNRIYFTKKIPIILVRAKQENGSVSIRAKIYDFETHELIDVTPAGVGFEQTASPAYSPLAFESQPTVPILPIRKDISSDKTV